MTQTKYKPLTKREKQINKKIKQDMIEKGIIGADKKRLNRKKFIEDTEREWNEIGSIYDLMPYMIQAFGVMLSHTDNSLRPDLEAIGAAKVIKVAIRIKECYEKSREEGKKSIAVGELYEYIKDILEA